MSQAGSSIAPSHLSIFAFLAKDIPATQLEGGNQYPGLVVQKGSRVMLTHFPRSTAHDVDHVRFYSNEHRVHGMCQPDDVTDFDQIVSAYITLHSNQALPYEEEASMISNDKAVEQAPSINSELLAEMEAHYNNDPEFARAGNETVLDVDDLADMMSTTNTRLEGTPIRNPIFQATATSTPAPPRPPTVHGSMAGKRHLPDSTMLEREQVAHAEESKQVEAVVNRGIGPVAIGMQEYALKTDNNIQNMGKLLSKQMDASKHNQVAIGAIQSQMNSISSALDPENLAKTMAAVCDQYFQDKEIQTRMTNLKSTPETATNIIPNSDPHELPVEKSKNKQPVKPILKAKKGRRSARFTLPDSDSDSDSEIMELIQNRTFDPQSSKMYCLDAMFSDGSCLAEDSLKSAENAMKRIRLNSDMVPKWRNPKDGLLSIFLCKDVFNFARKQGLLNEKFLKYWISYVFPSENEEKVYMYLNEIRTQFPKENLYKTLRALAFRMSPGEKTSIDALSKRQPKEGLLDLVLRLKIDIPICVDVKENEITNKIVEFIRTHEQDAMVKLEFKKAILPYGRKITEKQLIKIAESLDELLETQSGHQSTRYQQVTSNSDMYTDKEALELLLDNQKSMCDKIAALEQMRGSSSLQAQTGGKPKCQKCNAEPQRKKSGGFYPHCGNCFRNKVQISKPNLYSSPPVHSDASRPICRVCRKNKCNIDRSGSPFPSCYDCSQNRNSNRGIGGVQKWSNVQAKPAINSCKISLDDVKGGMTKNAALAVAANEIYEVTKRNSFDPDRYRMHVKVSNEDGSKSTRALIDTGANNEVLSLQACYDLGITHLIDNRKENVTLADGSEACVGKLTTTLNIGDVPYTSTFLVMDKIDGYGMMVGTQFMQSKDLMEEMFKMFENSLGRGNIGRGN